MLTYKDFQSRIEFIDYLNLYHNDRSSDRLDFQTVDNIQPQHYREEIQFLLSDLENIKTNWNNQSIIDIEKSVGKKNPKHLDIMQGQKYDKLSAGYEPDQPMYRVKNCLPDSFFYEYAIQIGLTNALARYHVQFPGEVTAWHTDIYNPAHEFLPNIDGEDHEVGKDKNIRRVLIALEEWDWGQFLLFGKTPWLNWHAGDVIYWPFGTPHGAANTGYSPRISVSITGIVTPKFREKIMYDTE